MFEFHGWAVLRHHTHDTEDAEQELQIEKLFDFIEGVDSEGVITRKIRNGLVSLEISGLHNHRQQYVFDLFKKIAELLPGSYGLLYIYDDEDIGKNHDHSNEFVVFKLVRGHLIQEQDYYLSPYIPTVEDNG
ncbi:hypothetical protein CDO73_01550 [Saccharibacillus sp. O23]|uniref:Imm7 family immunity protein n=1 Tax=Saccharibacillus sp. O23 TaxID=2009338 RepID=UPI000B4E76C4|nr:Imm7 family immunity protein [Saccharibacillus sp. O23]OWR32320.1 hypothetical protein CDO73_01550 [Saccharibacillus sp. O23]